MAKVIRIGELPPSRLLTNEDLFVVNNFIEDRTYSITWGDLVGNIKEISQPVFFSRGSETKPSIAFIDFNAGFYSLGPGAVAVTTNGTTRMSFDGSGNIDIGTDCGTGAVVFHSPVTYSCDTTFEQNVQVDGNVDVRGNIVVNGELDLVGNIGVDIEGNLEATGDVVIGDASSGCTGFFEVYSLSTYYCNTFFEQDLTVQKDITIGGVTTTGNLTVIGSTLLQGEVNITDDVDINNGAITIDASAGDIDLTGNLNVGGVLSGDGSGITNLNIPGSLSFKGIIDLTTPSPTNPQTGDLYITDTGPGTVHFSFNGISGDTFQNNQFVFYTVDNVWALGSVQDSSGFVTLSGAQTITGTKTYTQVINALGGINATGANITAQDLTLISKGTSASTIEADSLSTLTTKDYVDDRSLNAVGDFPLTLGAYITGSPNDLYDGSVAVTVNIDATPNNTANFIVARDASGNFSANVITANLNGRANVSKTLDVTADNTSTTKSYPLFIQNTTPVSGVVSESNIVYADSGLHYLPSTNTLTLSRVVADVTGNITGNADTATRLASSRTLWGQSFDGTANVSGNMSNVGNITPINGESNIGSNGNVWANVYATTFHGYVQGTSAEADRTKEKLTAGLHILSTNGITEFDGFEATTWYVDTSSLNVPNKIVVRDGDGSFSSNVITANEFVGPLTGNVTGNVSGSSGSSTGNAATATALQTPRTIWGQTFDGTSDVTGDIVDTGNILPTVSSTFDLGSSNTPYRTLYVDTVVGNIEGNSGSADKVNNSLTRGQYISDGPLNFDGSVAGTWNIDAAPNNLANFIVARDENGDFDAGTITATFVGDLTGDVTGNVSGSSGSSTGNAATATALETPRTIWGQVFDGTDNVSGDVTDTGNVIPTTNLTSTVCTPDLQYSDIYATTFHGTLDGVADTADKVNHSLFRGSYITGTYLSFNGEEDDTWDVDATPSNVPNKIVARDAAGNFYANNVTANQFVGDVTGNVTGNVTGSSGFCTGNAATATKLETARNLEVQITGATIGSGSASFDGTSNIEIIVPTEGIVDLQSLTALPE